MKKLRYLAEYIALRIGLAFVDVLPMSVAERFITGLADLWFAISVSRRRLARENILRSEICSDPKTAAHIARQSFRHFALVVLESVKSSQILGDGDWQQHIKTEFPPELQKHLDDPKQGVILATGHFGSWEIAAQLLSRMKPVVGVTRRMNNPYSDRLMQKRKPRDRFHLIPKYDPNDTARFLNILKHGDILALMIDQHASRRGMRVDFLGRPASTHTAVALLHLVSKVPLYFGYCRRVGRGKYEFKAIGPLKHQPTGNKEADIKHVLETLNTELEKAIREDPTQYLWAHRRWK